MKKKNILVVVHDAGGAEIIGAYVRKNPKHERFIAYGAGPAVRIFKRLRIPMRPVQASARELSGIMKRHADVEYALVAAPGWMSRTEINALRAAKHAGLKTVVYMDSWTYDSKRFGFPKAGWKKRLPDEFWVGDKYARAGIRRHYPNIPLRLVPNQYFADELRRFHALRRTAPTPDTTLFVSQDGSRSRELLEELLRVLSKRNQRTRLRIRYHPVDDRTRYDILIKSSNNYLDVTKSREKDLVKDLLRARRVIGTETSAMAVAVLCGIPTISLLGKRARPILPYPHIKRIRTIEEVERSIKTT